MLTLVAPMILSAQNTADSVLLDRDQLGAAHVVDADAAGGLEVISASRSRKKVRNLPVTVHVVTREEILRNGWTTLVDVLKTLPGIKVSQPGAGEQGETFLLRGLFGNYYTKILLNNIPLQPTGGEGMPIGAQLPVRQAERIEIIFGPASAVYGADATAGVINIVTAAPEKNNFTQADAAIGGGGYKYVNLSIGGKAGIDRRILQYLVYGSFTEQDDLRVYHEEGDLYSPLKFRGVDQAFVDSLKTPELRQQFFDLVKPAHYEGTAELPELNELPHESRLLGMLLHYRGLRFSYDYMHRKDHSSLGRTPYLFKYNNALNLRGETIQRVTLGYDFSSEDFSGTTNLSYLRMRLDNTSSVGVTYANKGQSFIYAGTDDLMAEQLITYQPNRDLEIIGGISYTHSGNLPLTNDLVKPFTEEDYQSFSTDKAPPHPLFGDFGNNPITFSNLAGFVQLYHTFEPFILVAGIRVDDNSLYGSSLNPRLALLYRLSEATTLRYSSGTSFRAPSSTFAYSSNAFADQNAPDSINYGIIPSPDLEPEIFQSAEVGLRHLFNSSLTLDAIAFANRFDDLISRTEVEIDKSEYPLATNNEARTNLNSQGAENVLIGFQGILRAYNIVEHLKLNVDLSMQYAFGGEELPDDGGSLDDVRMLPRFMAHLNISFEPFEHLYLHLSNVVMGSWIERNTPSAAAYRTDDYRSDGYYNLDAILRLTLSPQLQLFCKARNVFNSEYGGIGATGLDVDLDYNPQRLRQLQFGVSYASN